MMTIENRIKEKVANNLSPQHMELRNVSALHKGHAGDNGTGDTHFELHIISDAFSGKNKITRHRMVYSCLQDEFNDGLHALSVKAFAPEEAGKNS